jgi:hypothetical protein
MIKYDDEIGSNVKTPIYVILRDDIAFRDDSFRDTVIIYDDTSFYFL